MDVEKIKRKLLIKYPLFGSKIANASFIPNVALSTAATDVKNVFYNPNFMNTLTEDEQIFIFAHEICHIAFNHILRSENKDHEVWNQATDAVINAFLKQDGLKMVEGGVDMADAIHYDAETLYEKLLKEKQREQQNSNNSQDNNQSQNNNSRSSSSQNQSGSSQSENSAQGQSSSSDNQPDDSKNSSDGDADSEEKNENKNVGHDDHSMWEDAVKKHKESQKDDEEISEDTKINEKELFEKNKKEKRKELEELKKALSREATGAGKTTTGEERRISEIGEAKPLIDWRYVLREAIKYDVDWSYKNATIEDGVLTSHLEELPLPETEIVLDTSGSIQEILLRNFLRECKNILRSSRVKVGCFDTRFYGFTEIRSEKDIESLHFYGGGGTDFDVAVNAFSRRVENKIIFTDGDAPMPRTNVNAIWVVFGNTKIKPASGRVIYITGEQLDKLYSFDEEYTRSR